MDGKSMKLGTSLLIEISPDSKYNLNKNSGNFYELKFTRNLTGKSWNFGFG
jgi:hypothetical protein